MAIDIVKMRADMRRENRWFLFLAAVSAVVLASAGFAIGYFFPFSQSSQPVIVIFQPGSIVVPPTPAK